MGQNLGKFESLQIHLLQLFKTVRILSDFQLDRRELNRSRNGMASYTHIDIEWYERTRDVAHRKGQGHTESPEED